MIFIYFLHKCHTVSTRICLAIHTTCNLFRKLNIFTYSVMVVQLACQMSRRLVLEIENLLFSIGIEMYRKFGRIPKVCQLRRHQNIAK